MPKEVVFAGGAAASGKEASAKAIQTGRYDRKAIKARIDLEEWVDGELRTLYGLGEDDDDLSSSQELDLDLVLDEDADDRAIFIKNMLGSVKDQAAIDAFVTELLVRLKTVKANGK
eukprot:m.63298 g.63298  ORF g.63298 m.63298 type:complete len:116 (+) comp17771_c2_seq2:45-392(+)